MSDLKAQHEGNRRGYQIADAIPILGCQSIARNHPAAADADDLLEGEIIQQVLLTDSAGRHEGDINVRSCDGLDVLKSAGSLSREELHGLKTEGQCRFDVARIGCARAYRNANLLAMLNGCRVEARGNNELCSGGHSAIHLIIGKHGAGAHQHVRISLRHIPNGFLGSCSTERNLSAGKAALTKGLCQRHSICSVINGNNRNNTNKGKLF